MGRLQKRKRPQAQKKNCETKQVLLKSKSKEKQVLQNTYSTLSINITSCQLQQRAHEDRFFIDNDIEEFTMMMVCDGHANPQMAIDKSHNVPHIVDEIMIQLPKILLRNFQEQLSRDLKHMRIILQKTFIEMDDYLYQKKNEYTGGATCNLVLIDRKKRLLYNANIGDSRLILCDAKNNLLFESKDHNFLTDGSRIDLNRFSTFTSDSNIIYVHSDDMSLCVARAFGNFSLKSTATKVYDNLHGCVSVDPTITVINLLKHDRVKLYLTTDGPFDAKSQLSSLKFVQMDEEKSQKILAERCKSLVWEIAQRTDDDITIIMAELF